MTGSKAFAAVLRLQVESGTEGPSTPEGKFLAMALCLFPEVTSGMLSNRSRLFSCVQISPFLGARAYQDLENCQWIQGGRFYPRINESRRGTKHIDAMRALLNGYPKQAQDWLVQYPEKGLSVKNRLLLAILLDREELGGRLRPTSFGDLVKLTGFSPNQVKVQLQKLKEIGVVSGVVPGVTGTSVFGIAKSYIYLNLLHPFWSCFFPDWRAICLDTSLWQDASTEKDLYPLVGELISVELGRRPELKRYFHNLVLMLISDILSRYWHELRLNNLSSILQVGKYFAEKLLRVELSVSDVPWFIFRVADIAGQIQEELFKGNSGLAEFVGETSWGFCVLPAFSVHAQPLVILTNCRGISSGIDSTWLRANGHARWIEVGLVTRPDAAPIKLRSCKSKLL